jgi:hypothetical protein
MEVGTPGNIDKGFCLKCKTPMLIELVEEIRILCPDCVRDIRDLVENSKNNPDMKRFVLEPGRYQQVLPDGQKTRVRIKRGRRR